MAKQIINIGAVANDGTGDPLRDTMDKVNDNFTELYNVSGWGNYSDGETSPATISVGTTPVKVQIDALGSTTENSYLPLQIRGVNDLWDSANDIIQPINVGDSYDIRLDLGFTAKSGSPNNIFLVLDIGATQDGTGGAGSIIILNKSISADKAVPFKTTVGFPIFSLATFEANGGSFWLSTDTGTVTLGSRSVFIKRDTSGLIW